MTREEYLNLITSAWRDKPKYIAMVDIAAEFYSYLQDLNAELIAKFDVDTAVGQQLDVIGEWVGISRNVAIPVPGVFFSWDGTNEFLGWDFGIWQDDTNDTDVTVLPDDVYRNFVKAKIAANQWDGTTDGAYAIWDSVFTDITILIQDNLDMSYDLGFVGGIVDSLTVALIEQGYLPLKPEGVRVNFIYIPVDDGPLFGWDVESDFVQGWDEGSWARELV